MGSAFGSDSPQFQRGVSYTAWSSGAFLTAESTESMDQMVGGNVEWIAVCFWWFQDGVTSTWIYPRPDLYTASNESIAHVIDLAHSKGFKVMLKPMVDIVGPSWRGLIPASKPWFESYARFINSFATMAEEMGVELFCVGCEFDLNDASSEDWREIVSGVRSRYSGPITYAAGPTRVGLIDWWDALDYVGIDAYYPLSDTTEPALHELMEGWRVAADVIEEWQAGVGKPVIFTEVGYRSADGANIAPWNWQDELPVDLNEQVLCYEAAFRVMWGRDWFHGFYWWNWETDPMAGGWSDDGYTPQNKPAQGVLADWYARNWEDRFLSVSEGPIGMAFLLLSGMLIRRFWPR